MSISTESVAESRINDAQRIATGQANKDAPHLTVPFYMPVAQSIPLKDALEFCRPDIRKAVDSEKIRLLAIAHGKMTDKESSWPVQFVIENEIECAVLMDGDGLRFSESQPLSQEEAVAFWMGGFLGWNEKCPGLYQLRYALIES